MALHIDIDLTAEQKTELAAIPATAWFTAVTYRNAKSPEHPNRALAENNAMKHALTDDWISEAVKGKRVLDLFSANGAFTCAAALAGAREVVGLEFAEERVRCAEFVASTLKTECKIQFIVGDVYNLRQYFTERFDVVLCLGGLYHIADPALVLREMGALTSECMILQTSQVLSQRGNRARFVVRREDKTQAGLTSIRGGSGVWYYSPACLRELLLHGGFRVAEERRPPLLKRHRFPFYAAKCHPL